MGIVTVQSVSQCGERQAGAGGGADRGDILKRLSPVSNSSQRDYTMLSSLFNLRLQRGLFVSLVFHCCSLCHSITSAIQAKCGSCFRYQGGVKDYVVCLVIFLILNIILNYLNPED